MLGDRIYKSTRSILNPEGDSLILPAQCDLLELSALYHASDISALTGVMYSVTGL